MLRLALFRKRNKKEFQTSDGKLLYLEAIRGIAALAVVFAHIITLYFPYPDVSPGAASPGSSLLNSLLFGFPLGFLIAGHFSVIVFFILSGYVLTYRYYQTKDPKELQKQAAKRYFRLAIPVFATVMVAYFMISLGMMEYKDQALAITGSLRAEPLFILSPDFGNALYTALIGVFANSSVDYNPVLWTMPIELVGSFVIFGIALLVGKLRYRWLFYLGAIVVLSQTYYVGFILGLVLADVYHNTKIIEWSRRVLNRFYIAVLMGIILVLASIPMPWTSAGGLLDIVTLSFVDGTSNIKAAHYVGAFLLLFLVISVRGFQKVLSLRPFVWIGSLSFAIYLLHFLVLYSLGTWLFVVLWDIRPNIYFAAGISGFVVIAVTLLASMAWKKYIDDMSVSVSRAVARVLLKE